MATRKSTDSETPQATVRPQQYSGGEGWELGQIAPEDRFRKIDDDGQFVGDAEAKVSGGGRWVQVVVKGAPITPDVLRGLAPAEEPAEGDA